MKKIPAPKTRIRLDKHLASLLDVSRKTIQKWIKSKQVLVNELPAKSSQIIGEPDKVVVTASMEIKEQTLSPENHTLEYLYEDQHILMINKPVGLVVHPGDMTGTLVNALLAYPGTLSTIGDPLRPGIVHRLDKDTEGLMVIAKSDKAHESLMSQFKKRSIIKKYFAVIQGEPKLDSFEISAPISRHPKNRVKMAVSRDKANPGKEAITHVKVLHRNNSTSLVQIQPQTGRTHQIRVHLAHRGYPIIGDTLYHKENAKKSGQLLQAFFLSFEHPDTGQRLAFKLPLSERLK
jgi:23S rRNA pseudouridine1911/1915/1917 synthase